MALLTALAAFGFSKAQTPEYKSSVKLFITTRPDFGQAQTARILLRDYSQWLHSSFRAQNVIERLNEDITPAQLLGSATIVPSNDTSTIEIEIRSSNPDVPRRLATAWGEELIFWRNEQNAGLRAEDRIGAEFLDVPSPVSLNKPQTKINTAAGGVFGALLGILAIFAVEWFASGKLRRAEDVERFLDLPIIGTIPNK